MYLNSRTSKCEHLLQLLRSRIVAAQSKLLSNEDMAIKGTSTYPAR